MFSESQIGRKSSSANADRQDRAVHQQRQLKSADLLQIFAPLGTKMSCLAGTVIFEEGRPADGIYLIENGQLKLTASADDGRSMIVRIAGEGDVLGLSAVLNETVHETTAKTLMPCYLVYIAPAAFLEFLGSVAGAGVHALAALARDHREVFLCARRLALFPLASSRIAQVLIDLSRSDPKAKAPRTFMMVLSHAELASLVGTSRETVTRLLNDLERKRIITRDRSCVTILKPAELVKMAN